MSRESILKDLCYKIVEANMAPTAPTAQVAQVSGDNKNPTKTNTIPGIPELPTTPGVVTIQSPQQPLQPTNTLAPQQPQQNPVVVPPTNPINPAKPAEPTKTTQPQETTIKVEIAGLITCMVKRALAENKKIVKNAKAYYMENKAAILNNVWIGKKVAAKLNNKEGLVIVDIDEDSYQGLVDSGTFSMYEPVTASTKNFSIYLDHDDNNFAVAYKIGQLFQAKLAAIDIITKIAKEENKLELVCSSKEEISSNEVLSYIKTFYDEDSIISADLSELNIGGLKKVAGSLKDNGKFRVYLETNG